MRWIVFFTDTPAMLKVRKERQDTHYEYLRQHESEILIAGGCKETPESAWVGGAWVLNVASKSRAIELIERDPYFVPNCRSYRLFSWGKVFADKEVVL